MKKYNNIDELFSEGSSGFGLEPSAGLWEKIEARQFAGKRRRKAIYLWTLAGLLLLLTSVAGWFLLSDSSTPAERTPEYIAGDDATPQNQSAETAGSVSPESEIAQSAAAPAGETGSNASALIPLSEKQEPVKPQTTVLPVMPATSTTGVLPAINMTSVLVKEKTDLKELSHRNLDEIARMKPETIDPRKVKGMEEYLEKRNKLHLYTGLGATAAMAYYPATTDQFTWSADLAVGLKVHKFYFETGAGYQDMQERGIYQIDFRSRDSIGYFNEVVSFELNPQNPDQITYKTKRTTVYDSVEHYVHTTPLFKYSYINIPLRIGYSFFEKGKFSVSAETGIIFSKMISSEIPEVSLTNPEYELIAITNKTPGRVDLNFQLELSLRLNYRFAKSMSVAAQPVFTKYLNSIYDTGAGYPNVKPYTMGLRFGLYFDF